MTPTLRYRSLLHWRRWMVQQARREARRCAAELQTAELASEAARAQRRRCETILDAPASSPLTPLDLAARGAMVRSLAAAEITTRRRLAGAQERHEAARAALRLAWRDLRVIERLRDHAHAREQRETLRHEQAAWDELGSRDARSAPTGRAG